MGQTLGNGHSKQGFRAVWQFITLVGSMLPKRNLLSAGLLCLLLVLGTSALYWPVLRCDFITYDDPDYVTNNPHVRPGFTGSDVRWALTHTSSAEYHPVTMLSHICDCQLYGIHPAGHHLTNLLLHLANTILLFALLCSLSGALWPSAFASALFALHPLHVEPVAWISERKGLLSTFFGLLCLWAYGRYARGSAKIWGVRSSVEAPADGAGKNPVASKPLITYFENPFHCRSRREEAQMSKGSCMDRSENQSLLTSAPTCLKRALSQTQLRLYYLLALVFLALGLLSKPMLVTWPCVMLLLDYWPLGRFAALDLRNQFSTLARLVMEKIPFFALSLVSSIVTFVVGRDWGAITGEGETPLSLRVANSVMGYLHYLQKLFWPAGLSVHDPYIFHRLVSVVLGALLVLASITAFAMWQLRKRPYLAVGWLWYLGTLVPVIGLVHIGNHSTADRYSYVPTIGLFVMLGWAAAEFVRHWRGRRTVAAMGAATVLGACALCSHSQLGYWRNTQTLFRHALEVSPNDFTAYNNLGFYYDVRGELAQAERCYRAALTNNPTSSFAWEKLGALLISKGSNDEAVAACEAALALEPRMADAHCTLGLGLMKQGKRKEAMEHYEEAIRIRPDYSPAHYNLANALAGQGQFQQAREHYRESLRWDPESADAHNNLAYLLARDGKLDEAVIEFRAALKLKPGQWQAEYGLADALSREGYAKEAAEHFRLAIRARPDFPEALARLAWSLATSAEPELRNGAEAVDLGQRACRLTEYKQPASLRALAAAYAEAGRFSEALECAEKAQSLALAAGQKEVSQKLQELVETFRTGHPYRDREGVQAHSR